MVTQLDYTRAFVDGAVALTVFQDDTGAGERCTLHVHVLGDLVVTSGHIVACDPLVMLDTHPLAATIPLGRYPVLLSVAAFAHGDQRVAFALLRLSDHAAVRWENAVPQGRSLEALQPGHVYGYPVDAGTGCFMDTDAARALAAPSTPTTAGQEGAVGEGRDLSEELLKLQEQTYVNTWSWANLVTDPETGANVIAFSSGLGDGFYSSYWGYDAAEERVALMTDFVIVDDSWLMR